jgi:hypothetical protein
MGYIYSDQSPLSDGFVSRKSRLVTTFGQSQSPIQMRLGLGAFSFSSDFSPVVSRMQKTAP